jgi:hypothetical protein
MAGNRGAEELRELKEREGRAVGSKKRRRGCGSHVWVFEIKERYKG